MLGHPREAASVPGCMEGAGSPRPEGQGVKVPQTSQLGHS